MPQPIEHDINKLYALLQEARSKSSFQSQANLTKTDITKITKFKTALLATPFNQLAAISGSHAKDLRGLYIHYLAQMDHDQRKPYLEKIIKDLYKQLQDLRKIDLNNPNFTPLANAFNEKILRTPFSYFTGKELNREETELRNYFVLAMIKQIRENKLDDIKLNQSADDLKLLLPHIKNTKDQKVQNTMMELIQGKPQAIPLSQRAISAKKNGDHPSPDATKHKHT